MRCMRLHDLMTHLLSSIDTKCEELHVKNAEAQNSEAKVQDLQSQVTEQLVKSVKTTRAQLQSSMVI